MSTNKLVWDLIGVTNKRHCLAGLLDRVVEFEEAYNTLIRIVWVAIVLDYFWHGFAML